MPFYNSRLRELAGIRESEEDELDQQLKQEKTISAYFTALLVAHKLTDLDITVNLHEREVTAVLTTPGFITFETLASIRENKSVAGLTINPQSDHDLELIIKLR